MKNALFLAALVLFAASAAMAQLPAADKIPARGGDITVQPITHATLVLSYHNKNIYVDPTGGAEAFKGLAAPDIILVTDIHGDHMDPKTLSAIVKNNTLLVVPQAVADKLPADLKNQKMLVLNNGDTKMAEGIKIEAIPMYNLPEAADAFHTKGRGNGYVLTMGDKKVYLSGDTEDIPEMRNLKNIDVAFVCMNLPYTMDVEQAAQGVAAFKPAIVYPYHYRGQDVDKFKTLMNSAAPSVDVRLLNWYPSNP